MSDDELIDFTGLDEGSQQIERLYQNNRQSIIKLFKEKAGLENSYV